MEPQTPRCTVLLTFDFDAESSKMAKDLTTPTPMSQGTYGARVGLPRILDLLARYNIPATFFVPGIVAEMHPEKVRHIHAGGHEIGHHGYTHVNPIDLSYEDEWEQVARGITAIEKVLVFDRKGIAPGMGVEQQLDRHIQGTRTGMGSQLDGG